MSQLATTEHQPTPVAPKPVKSPRISPRIRRAIDALVFGECKTQKDAAALAGLNAEHLCRELKKPQIEAFYAQRVRQRIGRLQMRAAARIGELIDADSEHVSLDASKHTLAIAGISPPSNTNGGINISINNNMSAGYVIDLTPWKPLDAVQQQAAPGRASHTTSSDINDLTPDDRS